MIKLSILVCTLPNLYRDYHFSVGILDKLTNQSHKKPVQVLYLGDNKSMSVGEKRNKLLEIADGERICFVDDDDEVSDDYVDTLLEYCELDKDVVTIGVKYTQGGINAKKYDYTFKKIINTRINTIPVAGRVPDHLCLWRRSTAMRIPFPKANLGEDHRWADAQMRAGYDIEHRFEKIIYFYRFDYNITQTRQR